MRKIHFRWTGIRPLLMHNADLCDPLNEYTQEIRKITSRGTRKYTDALLEELYWLEWRGSLYFDDKDGIYVPSDNIEACLKAGAARRRKGKDFQSAVFVDDDVVPLIYDGPKEPEKLYKNKSFVFRKGAVPNRQGRIIRTRPRFMQWSIEPTFQYDERIIDEESIIQAAYDAGLYVGLGDWRPKYGRFESEVIE